MLKHSLSLFFLLGMLFISSTPSFAQGSNYDLFGFGIPLITDNAHLAGLAGGGVALEDKRVVSDINPAGWSWLERARFDIYGRYDFVHYSQNNNVGTGHNAHFGGFTFGTPIWDRYKAALALGFVPLTDASGELKSSDINSTQLLTSQGGVNMGFIGISAKPTSSIILGARLDVLTGNIRHLDRVSFSDPSIASSEFEKDYAISGVRPTFALNFNTDSLSENLRGFNFAIVYSPSTHLSVTKRNVLTPTSSLLDTTLESSGNGRYPSNIVAALSYPLSRRFQFLADLGMESYHSAFVYSTASDTVDATLRNSFRASIGIDRKANFGSEYGNGSGWDNWAFRAGAHYYQLPFVPTGTGGISEIAVSLGVGFPVSFESMLDFSLTGGERIPVNAGTAPTDLFFRLGVSISLSEKWFVPTRTQ